MRSDLRIIEGEVVHLQGIVDELFVLACAKVRQQALQLVSTSIGPLVLHVVAVVTPPAWQMRRVEVVNKVEPELPAALVAGASGTGMAEYFV